MSDSNEITKQFQFLKYFHIFSLQLGILTGICAFSFGYYYIGHLFKLIVFNQCFKNIILSFRFSGLRLLHRF